MVGRRGRKPRVVESSSDEDKKDSSDDDNEEEEEQEIDQKNQQSGDDTSREWDEYCFICNDGGNVICCDGCTNVAHLSCLKMKTEPSGEWHCRECLTKIQNKKQTTR